MRMLADAGGDEAIDALIGIAEKAHGDNRVQALDMLAQVRPGDAAVGQLLIDAMFSGRQNESQSAVWTLARLGTDDAKQAMITALTGDDENLAAQVAGAIGQAGMTKPIREALVSAAKNGKGQVKSQAMSQLINNGTEEGMQLAEAALTGSDPDAARQAAWALANVGTGQSRKLLEKALGNKDPQVRSAAVSALASSGDDASTDTLIGLVRDEDPSVRSAAVSALGTMGSSKAVDVLINVSRSGSVEDRQAAASALGQAGDAKAETALARMIGDADDSVATSAIYASYNGGEEIDHALANVLNDTGASQNVRYAAASQLRSRGSEMDANTQAAIEKLLGPDAGYGGYAYGGYYGNRYMDY
jgi:HEAT repeat protein